MSNTDIKEHPPSPQTGFGRQVLRHALTENATISHRPTMVDGHHLDGSCCAVTKQIRGIGPTVQQCLNRSLRGRGTHPREVVRVLVDLDDDPLDAHAVMSAA